MEVHWKIWFLGGFTKKYIYKRELLKKGVLGSLQRGSNPNTHYDTNLDYKNLGYKIYTGILNNHIQKP